jgi:hypothetical protein
VAAHRLEFGSSWMLDEGTSQTGGVHPSAIGEGELGLWPLIVVGSSKGLCWMDRKER